MDSGLCYNSGVNGPTTLRHFELADRFPGEVTLQCSFCRGSVTQRVEAVDRYGHVVRVYYTCPGLGLGPCIDISIETISALAPADLASMFTTTIVFPLIMIFVVDGRGTLVPCTFDEVIADYERILLAERRAKVSTL